MSQLNNFVSSHLGAVGLAMFVGCIVVLLLIGMLFIQSRRIALLSGRLDALTQGVEGESLEGVLDAHMETVVRVARDLDDVQARTAILEAGARLHFARLGLVRFNPFDDTGGNQSFAMSMLDANNDGFVITSLHSRTGTRLYAKAVFGGEAESTLSVEEARAVEIAVSQGGVGSAVPTTERREGTRAAGRTKTIQPRPMSQPVYKEDADEAVIPREAVPPKQAVPAKEVVLPKEAAAPKSDSKPKPAAAKPGRAPKVAQAEAESELEAEPVDSASAQG